MDDIDSTDIWMYIMQQIPVINDVLKVAMLCRESRNALYKIPLSFKREAPLAKDLIGRHIVRCSDGMLALTPTERCLTFQLDTLPVRVVKRPIAGLVVEMHPVPAECLKRLCQWWRSPPFKSEIWCDDKCVHHKGVPSIGDRLLIIVEVRRRDDNPSNPTLCAIATLKI